MSNYARFTPALVKASAGAGKTRRLSNRYIGLLAAGESPERILATTFTRKAAGEIFERVLTRLAEAALDAEKAAELSAEAAEGPVSCKVWAEHLARLVSEQHRLNVCTLDSFCVRLATSFALELGLAPGWKLFDEAASSLVRRDAIAAVFGRAEALELVRLIRLLNADSVKRSVYDVMQGSIAQGIDMLGYSGPGAWEWPEVKGELGEKELERAIEALSRLEAPRTQKNEPNKSWVKALEKAQNCARLARWISIIEEGIGAQICAGESKYYSAPISDEVRACFKPLIAHAGAVLLNRNASQTAAAYQLLKMFEEQLEHRKAAAHGLFFADVKRKLARSAILGELEPLYYRLDCRIHHLLLDEFQDTSRDEWRVVEPIAAELLSQADGERSFFCVGDTKQAIYRWRGGVAEIFDSLTQRWSQLVPEPISVTHRCSPPVVEAVNDVFGGLACNGAFSGDETARAGAEFWATRWEAHESARKELRGYVSFNMVPGGNGSGRPHIDSTMAEAARLIADIHGKAPEKSIGVLVRSNDHVTRMIYHLRRPNIGVAASEEGGSKLTDSAAVLSVLALFELGDHPGNGVARFLAAASPLGKVFGLERHDDFEAACAAGKRVRAAIEHEGVGALVNRCVRALAPHCGERDLKRLDQLAEAAQRYAFDAGPRCADFARYIELLKVEDAAQSSVRVMTVHQAKGLEFDAVVLPDLDSKLDSGKAKTFLVALRPEPLAEATRVMRLPRESIAMLDPERAEIVREEAKGRVAEELSVFYVEMTRARQALYLFFGSTAKRDGEDGKKKKEEEHPPLTFAGIARAALSIPPDAEGICFERGDPDWWKQRTAKKKKIREKEEAQRAEAALAVSKAKSRLFPQRRPSDLEGGASIDLAFKLDFSRRGSSARGLLIHKFFEHVEWIDDGLPSDDLLTETAAAGGLTTPEDLARLLKDFKGIIAAKEIRNVLSKASFGSDDLELWRERRFAVRLDRVLLSGTFDRVVVERKNGAAANVHLYDFKTDRVRDKPAMEERAAFYAPQVDAYRRALRAMTKLPDDRIKASLVFTTLGAVLPIGGT